MSNTVLITGASRGIGLALAKAFAKKGCNLILTCGHSAGALTRLAAELRETFHVRVFTSIGDIGDYFYVETLFREIKEMPGSPDILINNAGISHIGLLSDMTIEDWNRILAVNLTAVFSTCKAAVPAMVQRKRGKIINISSIWGNVGASCEVAYSATKGGINAFTRALAKELAPSGITVNAIACGIIDTDMNACFSAEERQEMADEIPVGRFGTPEEVAALAVQLTEAGDYLTGQIITLDGGML